MDRLLKIQRLLQKHPDFLFIKLHVKRMRDKKKDEYYGTSIKTFLEDNNGRYNQEGYIYLNIRDTSDFTQLLIVAAHEAWHIIDDKPGFEPILLEYFKSNLS
jgi:hypothetical protein